VTGRIRSSARFVSVRRPKDRARSPGRTADRRAVSWPVVGEAVPCVVFVASLLLAMQTASAAGGLQAKVSIVREAGSQVQAMTRRPEVSAQELSTSVAVFAQAVERAEDNRRYGRPTIWTGQESAILAEYREALNDDDLSLLYLRSAEAYRKKAADGSSMAAELARSAREAAARYWSKADDHLAAADKAILSVPQPERSRREVASPSGPAAADQSAGSWRRGLSILAASTDTGCRAPQAQTSMFCSSREQRDERQTG
jgi:hypothetical protein